MRQLQVTPKSAMATATVATAVAMAMHNANRGAAHAMQNIGIVSETLYPFCMFLSAFRL